MTNPATSIGLTADQLPGGIDVSNYTVTRLTTDILDPIYAAGYRHFWVQAVDPPPPYPPTQTSQQISDLLADGRFTISPYLFWWAFAGLDFLKRQMATLDGFEGQVQAMTTDAEDTTVGGAVQRIMSPQRHLALPGGHFNRLRRQYRPSGLVRSLGGMVGASASALVDDLLSWVDYIGQFPTTSAIQFMYSGPWYVGPYLGNPVVFRDRGMRRWTAQYDLIMDLMAVLDWGGYTAPADAKQYQGTTTIAGLDHVDLSVLSNEVYAQLAPPEPSPDPGERIAALESALGDVTATDGEIVPALYAAMQMKSVRKMRPAVSAVVNRLGAINAQILHPGGQ